MSPTRRAVRDGLVELGEQPTPGPIPGYTARLARELLGAAAAVPASTVMALPRRRSRAVPVLAVAAASTAAVVLGGALLGVFGQGGTGRLELAAAVDTTVVLPGGQTVPGRIGLVLPDGAIVRTGPNGRAAAGTVEFGPGLEGIVESPGHFRLQPIPSPGIPVSVSPVTTPTTVALPAVHHPVAPPLAKSVTTTTLPKLPNVREHH